MTPDATVCCPPLLAAPLDDDEARDLAEMFKAIADPVRLRLLSLIAAHPSGACACDLVAPVERSQPTVSHHLKVLADAGILHREKRGRWVWYSVASDRVEALRTALAPGPR